MFFLLVKSLAKFCNAFLFEFYFLACSCDAKGTDNPQCDVDDGTCDCKANFNPDNKCIDCKLGFYKKSEGLCHGERKDSFLMIVI